MPAPLTVNHIYNKTLNANIIKEVEIIDLSLHKLQNTIHAQICKAKHFDIREPLTPSDIQFHFHTPIYAAIPWAHTNIFITDSNSWNNSYYDYTHSYDAVIALDESCYNTIKQQFENKNMVDKLIYFNQDDTANFTEVIQRIYKHVLERRPKSGHFHCPPILHESDCPPISIITPTYNREKLIDIAFHNLLSTDYPQDKIEWIVIEDNEKTPHLASEKIISFQIQVPKIKLKYIPIEGRMSIGEKRNTAIEHATNDIILFMDDDDHYPTTSFRRRVAWLTKGTKCGETGKSNIACCTTLALYDLRRGVSAVNVPPYDIPFSQRISEATLTFKKSAWLERKFPNKSIAEGEDWIKGREDQVIEIPPQQIIVAFTHGNNQSSRRIPPSETPPACFWGFPKEYLIFIHKLVGIEVEDTSTSSKKAKK
jgi:hypothetical protein